MISIRTTTLLLAALVCVAPNVHGQAASKKIAEKIGVFVDPTSSLSNGFATAPLARPMPDWLVRPQAAYPKPEPTLPAPPAPARKPAEPRPVPEGSPLLLNSGHAELPVPTSLATIPLLKQYVVDMRKALELPALAVYAADRISLADPSLEISVQNSLRPPQPERVNQTPFSPWNIPDPFENAQTIRLRSPWAETPEPPLFVSPPTRR